MNLREIAILAVVGLALAGVAVPRFLTGHRSAGKTVLAQGLHEVERAKDAFVMERGLPTGTPVGLDQLVRAGYLKQVPPMPKGLTIHPGKVGEAVHFDETGAP